MIGTVFIPNPLPCVLTRRGHLVKNTNLNAKGNEQRETQLSKQCNAMQCNATQHHLFSIPRRQEGMGMRRVAPLKKPHASTARPHQVGSVAPANASGPFRQFSPLSQYPTTLFFSFGRDKCSRRKGSISWFSAA